MEKAQKTQLEPGGPTDFSTHLPPPNNVKGFENPFFSIPPPIFEKSDQNYKLTRMDQEIFRSKKAPPDITNRSEIEPLKVKANNGIFQKNTNPAVSMSKKENEQNISTESDFNRQEEWMDTSLSDTSSVPVSATVAEQEFFEVEIIEYDENVQEGRKLDVKAEIKNIGELENTQTIQLKDFDNITVDNENVTLGPGEAENIYLSWQTEEGDGGSGDIVVKSEDDNDSKRVSVIPPGGYFKIISLETIPDQVLTGENVKIKTEIKNTDNENGERDVQLLIDGTIENVVHLTLEPEESENLEFVKSRDNVGTYEVKIDTIDEEKTDNFTVVQTIEENITLNAGWNLFSLPIDPENHNPEKVFEDLGYYPTIFKWTGGYLRVKKGENMVMEKGYWVFAEEKKTIGIVGRPVEEFNIAINEGWNLMGVPRSITPMKGSRLLNYDNVTTIFRWTGGYLRVKNSDYMFPPKGYWLRSDGYENITLYKDG